MDRIKGAGHIANRFVTEDAAGGRPPTEITAEWLNAVQEEIAAVVEWAEIVLSAADDGQLLKAIQKKLQPLDATLTELAKLATAANQIIYSTGEDKFAMTALTAFARTLLDDADAATARETLGAAPLASAALTGTPTAPTQAVGNNSTRLATTAFVQAAVASALPVFSISALPVTDKGPIIVAEMGEVWLWSVSAYYTGYRSPLCGRPLFGHTNAPLASEIDAVGGTLSKTAYAALWGYAQENGLVVSAGNWVAGTHYFVNINSSTFRIPDLRNQFLRMTGTDADTANARAIGSRQRGTVIGIDQDTAPGTECITIGSPQGIGSDPLVASDYPGIYGRYITAGSVVSDFPNCSGIVRPANTAYAPRIHI